MNAGEKKVYRRPALVQYGRVTELTQGFYGRAPDCVGWLNTASAPQGICSSRSS